MNMLKERYIKAGVSRGITLMQSGALEGKVKD
jgi:hypothetical protein